MILENMICINLEKSKDKKESVSAEFDKYNMAVKFVIAVDGSEIDDNEHGLIGGYQALNQTIINILDEAIDNKLDSITIFEDDVRFTEDPMKAVEGESIGGDCDVLYLGARAFHATPKTESDRVFRLLSGAVLGHAIVIKKSMFDPWISQLEKFEKPSDLCLVDAYSEMNEDDNPKYKAYYFKPGIAYQEAGYSDNLNRECKKRWVD